MDMHMALHKSSFSSSSVGADGAVLIGGHLQADCDSRAGQQIDAAAAAGPSVVLPVSAEGVRVCDWSRAVVGVCVCVCVCVCNWFIYVLALWSRAHVCVCVCVCECV